MLHNTRCVSVIDHVSIREEKHYFVQTNTYYTVFIIFFIWYQSSLIIIYTSSFILINFFSVLSYFIVSGLQVHCANLSRQNKYVLYNPQYCIPQPLFFSHVSLNNTLLLFQWRSDLASS